MGLTTEQLFSCPHCWAAIEATIDLSDQGPQDFFQDCEICCRPIRIRLTADGQAITNFSAERE